MLKIVGDGPGAKQIPVQEGIQGQQPLGRPQHAQGVVQQSAALGMVQPLGRRIIDQAVAAHFQQFPQNALKLRRFHAVDSLVNFPQHAFRGFGGAGHQGGGIHIVLRPGLAQALHPQLLPPVVFLHGAAHLDHRALPGGRNRAIPHFAVDIAGGIAQGHIQIFSAVGGGALLGGAHQQKAFEFHIPGKGRPRWAVLHAWASFFHAPPASSAPS